MAVEVPWLLEMKTCPKLTEVKDLLNPIYLETMGIATSKPRPTKGQLKGEEPMFSQGVK